MLRAVAYSGEIMKILYKQGAIGGPLDRLGISQSFVKTIMEERDGRYTLKKPHYHTSFEVHIFDKGSAVYDIGGSSVFVDGGNMLVIPPRVVHSFKSGSYDAKKYTVTFCIERDTVFDGLQGLTEYRLVKTPDEIKRVMGIFESKDAGGDFDECISASQIFECISRIAALYSNNKRVLHMSDEDARLTIAKQYINDNINRAPTVLEVATYCCVSTRQLARIFIDGEGVSVAEYIRLRRCMQAQKLLSSQEGSLSEISELMSFNNEYYFNAFFKKYAGMSPGAYRKSFKK